MAGSKTIATSETRAEALKLQSSAYGVTIALVGGVCRIPGNLIDYVDFKAIPITTTTRSGKGGGTKTQNTTFEYKASVIMALARGEILDVRRIWRGKERFEAENIITTASTTEEIATVTPGGTTTIANASRFGADLGVFMDVTDFGESGIRNIALSPGYDYTVAGGVYSWIGPRSGPVVIRYQYVDPPLSQTAMQKLGVTLVKGSLEQAVPSWVTSKATTHAVNYPLLAYVHASDYSLGSGAQVENHNFEVVGPGAFSISTTQPDCDPAVFTSRVLMDDASGARMPADAIDSFDAWSTYCVAANLLMSPALTEQMSAAEFLTQMARLTNTGIVWSIDRLSMVPYADTAVAANGKTFTPNVTPIDDLTVDHFLADKGGDPVQVLRKQPSDIYNHVRVEFLNRDNYYNVEIAEWEDAASIAQVGRRTMEPIKAHWICDPAVASRVAQLIGQRSVNVKAQYQFNLPWAFDYLEPMDLVTLTEPTQGLELTAVRITEIEEDEKGRLSITAEDFPLGVATASLYPYQSAGGYNHDYSAQPGDVDAPVIFEAPVDRTTTGLEVYAAVKGSGANWGGCSVWVSLDGFNYRKVKSVYGPARFGSLTGAIASGAAPVSVSGQLSSGSSSDASALETLCYIGGAAPEYLAFTTATLTGAHAYDLAVPVRGAFGTSVNAHSGGDPFVRVDDAVAQSGSLDLSMIGKTIYFKFTSFNLFGVAEQSIADVSAYAYAITGAMANLPPSQPTGLAYANEAAGVRFTINKNPEPDVVAYSWRMGTNYAAGAPLDENGGTSFLLAMQSVGGIKVWVAARDAFGNVSVPASIDVAVVAPTVGSPSFSINGPDMVLDYAGSAGTFAIDGYEISYGDVYGSSTLVGVFKTTRFARRVDWSGSRRWWVAAVDLRGNRGAPVSVDASIAPPGLVVSPRAEIIDNNVLLYWLPPATGALPVDRYEVRKGASFGAGTIVGSNGNSTFAAVFEQQSGSYQYWIAAVDSANTFGTAALIPATVSQPPDYVLRTSIDSAFAGTKTNLVLDGSTLVGPANTSESWSTHFSSHSWSTPQDQISAGYPVYLNPSLTSASYSEDFDYGAVLPSTIITATLGYEIVTGSVSIACQIAYKQSSGDSWTNAAAGATSVLASNFRYVRVTWTLTCTAGANLAKLTSFNLKLAQKLKSDSGTFTITNAAAGVAVSFNVAFIDADTPIAQASGATPLVPVVDFSDVPNPTGFTVYLYNQAGTKVTGSGSWQARGY